MVTVFQPCRQITILLLLAPMCVAPGIGLARSPTFMDLVSISLALSPVLLSPTDHPSHIHLHPRQHPLSRATAEHDVCQMPYLDTHSRLLVAPRKIRLRHLHHSPTLLNPSFTYLSTRYAWTTFLTSGSLSIRLPVSNSLFLPIPACQWYTPSLIGVD